MESSSSKVIQYKGYVFLSMLYITITLAANVLIYKIAIIDTIKFSVGSLVVPFWFIIGDTIVEVYGYRASKLLIWYAFICSLCFALICYFLISIPSPQDWTFQSSYNQVLGGLPRVFIGSLIGLLAGSFINIYLLSKLKIIARGRFFILRSILSSGLGELIFTASTLMFDMMGIFPLMDIFSFIIVSYAIKITITLFGSMPNAILASFLKKYEGLDIYDDQVSFSPFKLDRK